VNIIKPIILFYLLCHALNFVQGQSKIVSKNSQDTLPMKVDSLKAAIVPAPLRPHLKGDTLEYNTEHIQITPNAVVEELLRRLPGLQIDANGSITFNGEKIDHLLVDGEDIFGSDPVVVTRNFDASKIARVQILNRESDRSVFTGIDDGTRIKTLNLVLKESAKNGYFGKVEAGGNTGRNYNANGALVAFRGKEQFAVLGLASNTGITNFTNNSGGSYTGISFLNGNPDALDASAGVGIPRFDAAALHYANTWNDPIDHLKANYQYSHYYTQPTTATKTVQIEPDSIYGQSQRSQSVNQQNQTSVNTVYDWAPNAISVFHFAIHGSSSQGQNQFGSEGTSTYNDTLVNGNQRTIQDKASSHNISGDISWRVRLGSRPDRVFSVTAGAANSDITTNGHLHSLSQFYQPNGAIQSMDTVDQRKQISSHSFNFGGSLNYTEPLWKGTALGLSYDLFHTADNPLQATYNRGDGKYDEIVDSLSTHFKTETAGQRIAVNLEGKIGHLSYTIGNDWLGYSYRQQDLIADSLLRMQYFNWAPRLLLNYTFNSATNLNFNYNAYTQQPTINQLTPATNNADPLHIIVGNPNLKPGFDRNFKMEFHRFKTWQINFTLAMTLTGNSISTKTVTDSLGRQVSQPVNVDGGKTVGLNFSINRKILGFDVGLHSIASYSRTVNYINTSLSRNDNYTGGGGFSLEKYVADEYSFQVTSNFFYLNQVSSINPTVPVHYWTQSQQGLLAIYLDQKYEINTNATYIWQEKTNAFSSSTSVLLWNSYVSRNFVHHKLVLRAQLNNILNQNAGITRTNTGNVNSQNSTNILGRYWMFSAIYHFDKKFKQK
jgi:Outer membrane protein beta-barrel family